MRKLSKDVALPIIAMALVAWFGIVFHGATTGSRPQLLEWLLSPGCPGTHIPATPEGFAREGAFFNFVAASQLLIVIQVACSVLAFYLLITGAARGWILGAVIVAILAAVLPDMRYSLTTAALLDHVILKQCKNVLSLLIKQEQAGAFAAALLTCSLGVTLTKLPDGDAEQQANELARRFERLSWVLYAGTLLLVVSILRLAALYSWTVTAEPAPLRGAVAELTMGLLRMWGIYYTTLLAAIYLPAYFSLRSRADRLRNTGTVKERRDWLDAHGLSLSIPDVLRRVVAILAPVIAGEASKLLDIIPK
jgi:hypothetical protein